MGIGRTIQYRIDVYTHFIASKLRKALNNILYCFLIIKKINNLRIKELQIMRKELSGLRIKFIKRTLSQTAKSSKYHLHGLGRPKTSHGLSLTKFQIGCIEKLQSDGKLSVQRKV